MIEIMVICIFFYLFGAPIFSFLGAAVPVAVGGVASVPSKVWIELGIWAVVMFVYEVNKD